MAFAVLYGIPRDSVFVIAVTILMTQFSISAMNEWADRERDAVAARWRPVALGRIPPWAALSLAVLFGLCAIPGALAFGGVSLAVVLFGTGLGWAYDLVLKATPFSFVPFGVAFPLLTVWIGIVSGRPISGLLIFFLIGAPLAIAIHLADSLPDVEADSATGLRSLAVRLGQARAVRLTQAMLVLGSVAVVTLIRQRPVIAALLAVAAAIGTVLTGTISARQPAQARWVVSATALLMVGCWIMVRSHG